MQNLKQILRKFWAHLIIAFVVLSLFSATIYSLIAVSKLKKQDQQIINQTNTNTNNIQQIVNFLNQAVQNKN